MKVLIDDLLRRIGKTNEIVLTKEELFLLVNGYQENDQSDIEQLLINYLDSVKFESSEDEIFLEIKDSLNKIKEQYQSEPRLLVDLLKIFENTIKK